MTDVPEGQVPRDEAFWRTYHAVNKEQAEALSRYRQRSCRHETLEVNSDGGHCVDCGLPLDDAMRNLGARMEDGAWVLYSP